MADLFSVISVSIRGIVPADEIGELPLAPDDKEVEFWDPMHAFNNKPTMGMKWCVCDAGATAGVGDGTGHRAITLDDDGDYEKGWWSEEGLPQWVMAEWTTPRAVNFVTLNTMNGYPNMAGVTVEINSGGWTTVFSGTLASDAYYNEWSMFDTLGDEVIYATGLRVTVNSTYGGNWARISELNAILRLDISDAVVSIDIDETAEEYDTTVPIGTTAANSLTMVIENTDPEAFTQLPIEDSVYGKYLIQNNKIEVSFGVNTAAVGDTPAYQFTKIGEFYSDEWSEDTDSMTISVSARDWSKFLQDESMAWGKVWTGQTALQIAGEIARMTGLIDSQVAIEPELLHTFDAVFVDQEAPWATLGELALADQAQFRFDRDGRFVYESTLGAVDASVKTLSEDTTIMSGTLKTELFLRKATVQVSPYSLDDLKRDAVWEAPNPSILSWGLMSGGIGTEDTEISTSVITVTGTGGFSTDDLIELGWPEKNGFIFLPRQTIEYRGDTAMPVIYDGELIKYKTLSGNTFHDCTRGFLHTVPQAWEAGSYMGQAMHFDIEFNNSPVINVQYPYISAIDLLKAKPDEGTPQAYIVHYHRDAYRAKLVVGNLVEWFTWLSGKGQSLKKFNPVTTTNEFTWGCAIAGDVPGENARQRVGSDAPVARTVLGV